VLSSFGEELGLDRERALRVAGAFGGGMARRGETCGAVTGALMVIGLKYGKTKAGDDGAREKTYELVGEFIKRFKSRHGSICCRELLGCDLSNPEGREAAYEKGLFTTLCPQLVRDVGEILEHIL
jgi:C_GCAxxG_C_C family probable redox protein